MIHMFKILISLPLSLMCIYAAFLSVAQAQTGALDIVPPKSQEGGASESISFGVFPDLFLTPDKPEILLLEQDVSNIIVGNTAHLSVSPDTPRRLILVPRQPGSTFLRLLAEDGSTIMERHIIIAAPKKKENYVRVRRSCLNGDDDCQEYSMYYCPNMCHELGLVEGNSKTSQEPRTASPLPENGETETEESKGAPPPLRPLEPADGPPIATTE